MAERFKKEHPTFVLPSYVYDVLDNIVYIVIFSKISERPTNIQTSSKSSFDIPSLVPAANQKQHKNNE